MEGKMSKSKIKKMQTAWQAPRKQTRIYHQEVVDQIPIIGGDFQPGDEIYFNVMTQKNEDYEQFESEVWPVVAERVINMQHRWWVLSKILDRSEDATRDLLMLLGMLMKNAPELELPTDLNPKSCLKP